MANAHQPFDQLLFIQSAPTLPARRVLKIPNTLVIPNLLNMTNRLIGQHSMVAIWPSSKKPLETVATTGSIIGEATEGN